MNLSHFTGIVATILFAFLLRSFIFPVNIHILGRSNVLRAPVIVKVKVWRYLDSFSGSGHIPLGDYGLRDSSYTGKVRVKLETDSIQPVGSKW